MLGKTLTENGQVIKHYMAAIVNFTVYVGEVQVFQVWGDRAELVSGNTASSFRTDVDAGRIFRTKEGALKAIIPEMKAALESLEFVKKKLEADIEAAEKDRTEWKRL